MFTSTQQAPPAGGAGLRRLRFSLNTPVVAIDELPVGPAAASIAIHGSPDAPKLVLALRSVRSGQLAFFVLAAQGPLGDEDLAVEAALGFAEALGFLFDEDAVEADGDGRQARIGWCAFLGEPEPPGEPAQLSRFRFRRAAQSGGPEALTGT